MQQYDIQSDTLFKVSLAGYRHGPYYVMAGGYDEARYKVIAFLEQKREEEEAEKPVVTNDGSLSDFYDPFKETKREIFEVTGVEIVTSKIIR